MKCIKQQLLDTSALFTKTKLSVTTEELNDIFKDVKVVDSKNDELPYHVGPAIKWDMGAKKPEKLDDIAEQINAYFNLKDEVTSRYIATVWKPVSAPNNEINVIPSKGIYYRVILTVGSEEKFTVSVNKTSGDYYVKSGDVIRQIVASTVIVEARFDNKPYFTPEEKKGFRQVRTKKKSPTNRYVICFDFEIHLKALTKLLMKHQNCTEDEAERNALKMIEENSKQ